MTLQHININDLTVSSLNVRKYAAKECADLVTSIRALGLLQPLLVRPKEDGFEVIAGQRRLNACRILAEDGEIFDIPCLVMGDGDDIRAVEASLAENLERLPMDEVDQYKAFAKLHKDGRGVEDIADTFGITPRMVAQRLALGRLHAPILTAYRKGDIHARDIRSLTMASPKQQKAWWALVKDGEAFVPTGQRLKDWLFGGAEILTENALFDVEASGLAIVTDLFGDKACFADSEAFWTEQSKAIEAAAQSYRDKGWLDVITLETGAWFTSWEHSKCSKADGGKVFVTVTHQGEVTFHEGYITNTEAKRRERTTNDEPPAPKPELNKPAQNYVDLHRHAAVRADMLRQNALALRLIAAHMIAGSSLWCVKADPQKPAKPEIAESLEANTGHIAFEAEREAIASMLGFEEGESILDRADAYAPRPSLRTILIRLHELNDVDVVRVLTFLMADSLSVNSPLIDGLGGMLGTDMSDHWQPDQTFFDLIRDKHVLNAMVGEYAGLDAAQANAKETAKTQRSFLTACLDGTRTPADPNWTPRYMSFPQGSYRNDAVTEVVEAVETIEAVEEQRQAA